MPKVVTSGGVQDFVETGKHEVVKPGEKPHDMKADVPRETKPETKVEPKAEPVVESAEDETGLEPTDAEFSDRTKKRLQKKHAQLKDARAEAAKAKEDAEADSRFAEQQFNERKLAEARTAELEAQLRQLQVTEAPKEPELKEPQETDAKYKNDKGEFLWKEFSKDLARFEAANAIKAEQKRVADQRESEARQAAQSRHESRIEALSKEHPDYEDVFKGISGTEADRQPQHVLNYLWESDRGEEIRYYLAKNPVEATRIAKMKPILGLVELGKLEDKLTKPANTGAAVEKPAAELPRGGAPAPITPISGEGTAGINTDPSKMNFRELRAFERERSKKKA